MRKSFLLLVAGISVLFVFSEVAQAQLINYNRRRGAGAARPAPAKPAPAAAASTDEAEKPAPFWAQTAPAVTNAVEKKYDVNRDGKLQPAEVKIYLRDVIQTIQSKGGIKVDTDILKQYDKSKDGVVSRYEMLDITNDLAD